MQSCLNRLLSGLFLLGFLMLLFGSQVEAIAQNAPADTDTCKETLGTYEEQGFIVKKISIKPLLKFMPSGLGMDELLQASINRLKPTQNTLEVDAPFNLRKLSLLLAEISDGIERQKLRGQTGFAYIIPRVNNCNSEANPRTLEVEYLFITAARPSYRTGSFELLARKSANKEQAGNTQSDENKVLPTPYIGYNGSRGLYAGTTASFETGSGIFEKVDMDVSGSSSSGVADLSLAGSREFASGPLSFAEWRIGYKYLNVPADPIRLKEGTVLGQFFCATRPLGSHNLFLRFGTSVEGGNRQTNLDANLVPESSLAQSGYGAIKLYAGGTFNSQRQDFKTSYGLQLGNSGEGLRVNYVKHIFDTAYRLRLMPRDHSPFQAEARFTAGVLHDINGNIPVVERFFGGNVEREFIEGDTWRISANPFIRSFPQNRLNLAETGLPIGGTNFVSFNLTLAQTVWHRQLLPKEIKLDPDIVGGFGGALLLTRRYFRQQEIEASDQYKVLREEVSKLRGVVNDLKTKINTIQRNLDTIQPENVRDAVAKDIEKLLNADPDTGSAPLPDVEDAIEAALSEPETSNLPVAGNTDTTQTSVGRLEVQAQALAKDDPENETTAFITVLRDSLSKLRGDLPASGGDQGLGELDKQLRDSLIHIKGDLTLINQLSAYRQEQVEPLIGRLNEPSPKSNRKLDVILDDIQNQIKPIQENVKQEIKSLPLAKRDTDPQMSKEALLELQVKREALLVFQEQLDAVAGFVIKSKAALKAVSEFKDQKQFDEVKFNIESLTVGYGSAIPAYLSAIDESVRDLQRPFADRNMTQQWNSLNDSAMELTAIQGRIKSGFKSLDVPSAEQKANQTVAFTGRVLGVFFRELNIIAISPVVTFDAARLGPLELPDQKGFRYGSGPGVRFSLVNVDFTAGYSFNLNRRPGEGRGAFTFTLAINDLFR